MYASDLKNELRCSDRNDRAVYVRVEGEDKVRRVMSVDLMNISGNTLEILPFDLSKDQVANRERVYVISVR